MLPETAVASVDAGSSSPPPSAPASTAASTGADGGGNGAGGALLTDDTILGITPEDGSAPSSTDTPAAPAATTTTAAPAAATPAELTIEDFKPLFQSNPKLQSLWDKYDNGQKLVAQFGTVADARKAAETVQMLGGVQHLESLAAKAADVDQTDATFFNGDKPARVGLAKEWYDGEGPHEFAITSKAVAEQVDATLEVMRERDSGRFLDLQDRITRQALGAENFGGYLANLARAMEAGQGIEEAAKAILTWGQRVGLDKDPRSAASPDAQRIAEQRQKLTADQQSWTNQQQQSVIQAADTEVGTNVQSEIEKALGDLKHTDGRPVFGERSTQIRSTIAGQVRAALDEALAKNPVLVAQVKSLQSKGLQGRQKELVDLTMRSARLQMPKVIEAVLKPWTDSVVSQANGAAQRAAAGASRVDVSGGATSGGSTKPKLTIKEVKDKNMTPEQILDF